MKRRILAILLAAIMVLSAVPFSVFAEEATVACPGKGEIHTKDNCDFVKFKEVLPVCDTQGYTVYTCEGCGDQFAADIIPAKDTPHKLVKATKAPTCTEDGIKEDRWQCIECKAYFEDADAKKKCEKKDDYVAPKLDHKLNGKSQFKTLANDCTKEKCELCGKVQTISTHKYHEWTLVNFVEAPTCKDTGTADYKCATKNCTATKTVTVEASKYMHDLTYVAATNPVCGPNGNVEHYSCSVCGKNYATKDANIEDALTTVKGVHTGNVLQAIIVGTCTQKEVRTYQCTVCLENYDVVGDYDVDYIYNIKDSEGNLLKDKEGNLLEFVESQHNYEMADGSTFTDNTYTVYTTEQAGTKNENLVIAKDANGNNKIYHYFNPQADVYTKETCTTYGYVQRLCVKCGDIRNEQVKKPTGHDVKNATLVAGSVTAASCLTAGSAKYKCPTCEGEFIQSIPATGHKDVVVKLGTCATKGFIYTICTNGCSGYGYTVKDALTLKVGDETKTAKTQDENKVEVAVSVKDGSVSWGFGDHEWQTETINAGNCTTNGSKVEYCTLCKSHKNSVIYATGHKFVLNWADGTKDADKTLKNSDEYKAAIADGFTATAKNKGIILTPTDCSVAPYLSIKCADCDAFSGHNAKSTTGLSLNTDAARGHKWQNVEFLPQCKDDGNTKNWDYTKGYTIDYCAQCGMYNEATRKASGKTYAFALDHEYSYDEATEVHNLDFAKKNNLIPGNCTQKGLDLYPCITCGKNIIVVQAGTGAHVPPANVADYLVAPVAPKCGVAGSTGKYQCTKADCLVIVEDTPIPALKHNLTKEFNGTAATCTATGVEAIYSCSQPCCKNIFFVKPVYNKKDGSLESVTTLDWAKIGVTKDEDKTLANAKKIEEAIIKTVPHVAGTVNKQVNATCLDTGMKPYVVCKNCKQNFVFANNDALPKKDAKFEHDTPTKAKDLVIPANGHSYVGTPVEATCTTPGYEYQECSVCDFSRVINYIEALGHELGKEVTITGSCKKGPSYKYKPCTRANCPAGGKVLTTGYTYFEHKNAAGLAIGLGDETIICTVGLKKDARTCKACGWEATADHHIEKTTEIKATCTTDGYTVVTCAGCNEVLKDATKLEDAPALNHKLPDGSEAWVLTKTEDATETATGTKYFECSLCKATKTEVIPPVSTIYLDLTYANANGKEGFAEYSLITVNVLLSSKKAAIRTLSYELNYDEKKLEFVSAKFDSTLLKIAEINDTVVDEKTGDRAVKFAGMSPNAVEVGEAAVIATITFRAIAAGTTESFEFANAEAYLEAGAKVEVNKDIDNADTKDVDESKITIATLMDVYTKAGTIDMQDALAIYDLMTNSEYNVAADLDKDGEITANDLQLFYSIFVGTMKKEALRNYEVN